MTYRTSLALLCGATTAASAVLSGLVSDNPHALTINPILGALLGLGFGYWIGGTTR